MRQRRRLRRRAAPDDLAPFPNRESRAAHARLPPEQRARALTVVSILTDPGCGAYQSTFDAWELLPKEEYDELFDREHTPNIGELDDTWAIMDHLDGLRWGDGGPMVELTHSAAAELDGCTAQTLGWLKQHSGIHAATALRLISARMQDIE